MNGVPLQYLVTADCRVAVTGTEGLRRLTPPPQANAAQFNTSDLVRRCISASSHTHGVCFATQ